MKQSFIKILFFKTTNKKGLILRIVDLACKFNPNVSTAQKFPPGGFTIPNTIPEPIFSKQEKPKKSPTLLTT